MNILIVSATYLEIEPLLLQFRFEKKSTKNLEATPTTIIILMF